MRIFPYWLQRLASYNVGRIPGKIIKIIRYIPLLWRDEDWSDHYILILLQKKLKMVKVCLKNGYAIHEERVQRNLALAIRLCDDIVDDEFCKNEWEAHTERWGELRMKFGEKKEKNGYYRANIYRTKVESDLEDKQESREMLKIAELEGQRTKDAYKQLFDIMAKHIREWWD